MQRLSTACPPRLDRFQDSLQHATPSAFPLHVSLHGVLPAQQYAGDPPDNIPAGVPHLVPRTAGLRLTVMLTAAVCSAAFTPPCTLTATQDTFPLLHV
ncbi:hypothetical protein E2C01_083322 [Portunus trituberculatus]|uniref:Uncharacterized protein n=1 Tax=Portunus trituberculatus TaxID=210409 RepID=A0A5B7IUU5_PORTR|nr:hypothetical protein [Portunus trituberculatus]